MVLIQSVQAHDAVMGLFGGLFMGQALLNVGCCGPNGCGVPSQTKTDTKNTPITFTEIKSSEEE
ncbi:MAG: hypothetical protein CFE21_04060 [Bacteroidetes bacterium B1(2017)]|nr:MAG: hypothetical protein CFE21_04060 [Bacteroidetes bacterium B1(2017)]